MVSHHESPVGHVTCACNGSMFCICTHTGTGSGRQYGMKWAGLQDYNYCLPMPVWAVSRVLVNKSPISVMRLEKQKNASASAFSTERREREREREGAVTVILN